MVRHKFDPIGKCVYCGSTEPPLTDEHILPQGLGGREFLPKASCEPHRLVTHAFETEVLRKMMWPLRVHLGMRSKKRKHPAELPVWIARSSGAPRKVMLSAADTPIRAVLPKFTPPGIILGTPSSEAVETRDFTLEFIGDHGTLEQASKQGISGMSHEIPLRSFARMLAKIAHCQAVGTLGLHGFEPMLLDVILGRDTLWSQLVGCLPDPKPPPDNTAHWIQIGTNDSGFVLTQIRLFANIRTAVYVVVTGRILD